VAVVAVLVVLLLIERRNLIVDDMCTEEILKEVFDQTFLTPLEEYFQATPYVLDEDGSIVPLLRTHEIFSKRSDITIEMVLGLVRRNMTPHLPDLYIDDREGSAHDSASSELSDLDSTLDYEIVDLSSINLDDMEADPLEGFDEFYRFFDDEICPRYEDGAALEDLLDPDWKPEPE